MAELDLTISRTYSPYGDELRDRVAQFDDELRDRVAELALKEGYGVIEDVRGMAGVPHQKLRGVWEEPHRAEIEVCRLIEAEGVYELLHSDDPESPVYRSVSFFASRVVLTEVNTEIVAKSSYRIAEEQ